MATMKQLIGNPDKGLYLLINDPSIFVDLDAKSKKKIFKLYKGLEPKPECKKDHEWIVTFMKEELKVVKKEDPTIHKQERLAMMLKLRAEGKTLKAIGEVVGLGGFRVGDILRKHKEDQEATNE